MPLPEQPRPRSSWLSILLALVGGLGAFAGLFILTGGAIGIAVPVVAAGLIFGMAAVHYLIWGWWLSNLIHREAEAEADGESAEKERPGR